MPTHALQHTRSTPHVPSSMLALPLLLLFYDFFRRDMIAVPRVHSRMSCASFCFSFRITDEGGGRLASSCDPTPSAVDVDGSVFFFLVPSCSVFHVVRANALGVW